VASAMDKVKKSKLLKILKEITKRALKILN